MTARMGYETTVNDGRVASKADGVLAMAGARLGLQAQSGTSVVDSAEEKKGEYSVEQARLGESEDVPWPRPRSCNGGRGAGLLAQQGRDGKGMRRTE